jgi:hypothetical protein
METQKIVVLDPTFQNKAKESITAPVIKKSSTPRKIGFLWNTKPNGDILLEIIRDRLSSQYGPISTRWCQKDSPSSGASQDILSDLASGCDLVITASAD